MASVRLVLLMAALALAACGGNAADETGAPGTTPITVETATTAEPPTTAETTTTTAGDGEVACSAAGLDVALVDQPDLPPVVASTRREIVEVATDCDFDVLADLAQQGGDEFTYSFGDAGDPAEFWRREEAAGREPMRFLVELLDRPYGVIEAQGATRYAWPSAFTYDSWGEVPEADRDALRPLYDEEDFADFETFGGYIGYRVLINDRGDWTAFVAGD